jgi:hypothetical protein
VLKNSSYFFRLFASICISVFAMSNAQAKDYSILVLPSGGATGIIPATLLEELEKQTNKRVYELFDEIWGSSIGAMMATLLTVPKDIQNVPSHSEGDMLVGEPRTAAEVVQFIEDSFSHYYSAVRIRGSFRSLIPSSATLKDTKIPIRILSAKITDWHGNIIPKKTELKGFCKDNDGHLSLASIACGSCSLSPVYRTEPLNLGDGEYAYCIDAGHEFCGSDCCMNPMSYFMQQFSSLFDPKRDTISIFFLSNGWVTLEESPITMKGHSQDIPVKLFNVNVDLESVFKDWKQDTWTGWALKSVNKSYYLENLAGLGAVPTSMMKKVAKQVVKTSPVFQRMVGHLLKKSQREI